jgi:hypothetical protein
VDHRRRSVGDMPAHNTAGLPLDDRVAKDEHQVHPSPKSKKPPRQHTPFFSSPLTADSTSH